MKRLFRVFQQLIRFATAFSSDACTYFIHCGVSPFQLQAKKMYYKVLIEAHALEKGLSLSSPRPLFGESKIRFLIGALKNFDLPYSSVPAEKTCGVLRAYVEFHDQLGVSSSFLSEVKGFVDQFVEDNKVNPRGGTGRRVSTLEGLTVEASFLVSRHSVRTFKQDLLPRDLVTTIVTVAQSAPSQCNRQASKVYLFQSKSQIDELLRLQSGASGFAEEVRNLFIVTSDLAAWGGPQQRNQAYVDGGLFSSSLLLACHAFDVASCPLNLAVTPVLEKKIKRSAGIGMDERLIMMIAVGLPTEGCSTKAASSPRRRVEEILAFK